MIKSHNRRISHWTSLAVCAAVLIGTCNVDGITLAEEDVDVVKPAERGGTTERPIAFAIPAEEFWRLSSDDRYTMVRDALLHRMQVCKNLHYEATLVSRNHEYRDGVIGAPINQGLTFRHRHWVLGDAYRKETDMEGPVGGSVPVRHLCSGFDRLRRQAKSSTWLDGGQITGLVNGSENTVDWEDRYGYWLDGEDNAIDQYHLRYLITHSGKWTIAQTATPDIVRLEVPWRPAFSRTFSGKQIVEVDPSRGFIPIRGRNEWCEEHEAGRASWRKESFETGDPQVVGDIWMPMQLTEILQASTAPRPDIANVFSTNVLSIEAGTVVADDLVVKFAPGTVVRDETARSIYVIGDDGLPAPETLLSFAQVQAATSAPSRSTATAVRIPEKKSRLPVYVQIAFVLGIGISIVFYWFSKPRGSRPEKDV